MQRLLLPLVFVVLHSACASSGGVDVRFRPDVLETVRDSVGAARVERVACLEMQRRDSAWHVTEVEFPEIVATSDTTVQHRGCPNGMGVVHNHPPQHLRNERVTGPLAAETERRARFATDLCYLSTRDILMAANKPRPVSFVMAGPDVLCWWSRSQARKHTREPLLQPPGDQQVLLHDRARREKLVVSSPASSQNAGSP